MEISCIKKSPAPFPAKISKFKGQSVRALPLRILTVGKKRSPGIQLIVEEFNEKIRHYCNLEDIHIKSNPRNTSNVKAQIEAEDMIMMQHIKPEDWVVVLDEHGADICSEQMADLVGDAGRTGSARLAFCIGGPYGHGPQLRERADVTIRLSSLVLNHQIALILLLEQLYRAKVPSLDAMYQNIGNPLYSKSQDLHTIIIAHLQLSMQVVSKHSPNHKALLVTNEISS